MNSRYLEAHERTIAEAVYTRLRQDILEGMLPPGQRIDQNQICSEFGISRTPLREVLHRLQAEGLVVIHSHKGAEVSQLSTRDIEEFYSIRAIIESHAARLATERASSQSITRLRRCLEEMADVTSEEGPDRLLQVHRDFHNALYTEAGNYRLSELIDQLRSRCDWYRMAHLRLPHQAQISLEEHRAIADAYAAGDCPRVEELVRENLENTARTLVKHLSQNHQTSQEAESDPRSSIQVALPGTITSLGHNGTRLEIAPGETVRRSLSIQISDVR